MASRHERTDPTPDDPRPDKGKDDVAPGHNKPAAHPVEPAAPAHAPGKFGGTI